MKKALIAGAASAVLAAMPVLGVFATGTNVREITDVTEIDLPLSCTMTVAATTEQSGITTATLDQSGDATSTETDIATIKYSATMSAGSTKEIVGTAMTIFCNDSQGYELDAVGAGTSETGLAYMGASSRTADDIPSQTTGGLDGDTSEWAFKIAVDANTYGTITTGYNDYIAVPATSQKIVGYGSPMVSGSTITVTPTYKVSFATDQAAATYTGKVKYTLVHPQQ